MDVKGSPINKISVPYQIYFGSNQELVSVPPFRRNARAGYFINWKGPRKRQGIFFLGTKVREEPLKKIPALAARQ
ncbi:hypothetical protein AMR41_21125 [Hapalosiphon sp. MRB220]|nr:hypothetical protein AMR41_21125 [Hapalosiphon sp. MRB220]